MKRWESLQLTLEKAEKFEGKSFVERKKLVYQWVRKGEIPFVVFDELMTIIAVEKYRQCEESSSKD